jgi:hypothetical protein
MPERGVPDHEDRFREEISSACVLRFDPRVAYFLAHELLGAVRGTQAVTLANISTHVKHKEGPCEHCETGGI